MASTTFKTIGEDPTTFFRLLKMCWRLQTMNSDICRVDPRNHAALREVRVVKTTKIIHDENQSRRCHVPTSYVGP